MDQFEALALAARAKKRREAAGKSTGQRVKEFFLGDDDPNTQNLGEKIGSTLNKAGEAMTLGLIGDEASAAAESLLPGVGYDTRLKHYRDQERVLERDNPGTALAAEIGGGLMGVMLPGGQIGQLARTASLPAKIAASAAAGGGMGGLYGFMEGEGVEDRAGDAKTGAIFGGAVGGAIPIAGAGMQRALDARAANTAFREAAKNAPSPEALRAQGRALYDAVDDAGVQFTPQAFDRTRASIRDALRANTGFDELPGPGSLTPNSARVSQIMDKASARMAEEPTAALPFRSLDQMRRQAGVAAGNVVNKADQKAGMEIISGLDDMVRNASPDDVVTGDVEALKTALPRAREAWSRMTRSQLIDDAIEAGNETYLSGGSSGVRNQFKRLLSNKKTKKQFSPAERKMMARVINGTVSEQAINLLGGGMGRLAQAGLGFGGGMALGPAGATAGALAGFGTGAVARKAADAIANKNAEIIRAIIANGGIKELPVASDAARRITEALARRIAAAGPQ